MRRVVLTSILFLCAVQSSFTRPVYKTEAQRVAEQFALRMLNRDIPSLKKGVSVSVPFIESLDDPRSDRNIGYVAAVAPKGFIVLSADTDIEPVIAYSFRHNWNSDTSDVNILYQILLRDLQMRIKAVQTLTAEKIKQNNLKWLRGLVQTGDYTAASLFYQWPEAGTTTTGGWVETTWHQHQPYNVFCPIDLQTGHRSLVGCVATAFVQVVNYHHKIGDLFFDESDRYSRNSIDIDADSTLLDFPSLQRLNHLLDDVKSDFTDGAELDSTGIAALCFASGIVLCTSYSCTSSGASVHDISNILLSRCGYFSAMVEDNPNRADFYNTLTNDMITGFPAILAIRKSNSGAHAVVADGYNTDGFYHLNFGWGASSPDPILEVWYHFPEEIGDSHYFIDVAHVDIRPVERQQAELVAVDNTIEFSVCRIGECSSVRNFSISNPNQDPVFVHDLSVTGPFGIGRTATLFADTIGTMIIPANGQVKIYVRFQPELAGFFESPVIISYSSDKLLAVDLLGVGVPREGSIVDLNSCTGVWDKTGSPYYVCTDFELVSGQKLDIRAGSEVVFMGPFGITVGNKAKLKCVGAEGDSIRFSAFDPVSRWRGIFLRSTGFNDTLSYCVFTHSRARAGPDFTDCGGAIRSTDSRPSITHCRFCDNKAYRGGALWLDQGPNVLIDHCVFQNNTAEYGGALYLHTYTTLVLRNSLLFDNCATYGGAIGSVYHSECELLNVTMCRNKAYIGGALAQWNTSNFSVVNSIIWNNEATLGHVFSFDDDWRRPGSVEFRYTDVDTSDGSNWVYYSLPDNGEILWGPGVICEDPLFRDPDNGFFALNTGSPCIDAGDPDPLYNDREDPHKPGFALWPAMGGLRGDMGVYGGLWQGHVVPVEFAFFRAQLVDYSVHLIWQTESESDNYGFQIERSIDDGEYENIGFQSAQNTSAQSRLYRFVDKPPAEGQYMYRLKQIDRDGSFSYSDVMTVVYRLPMFNRIEQNYPNPFNSNTTIRYQIARTGKVAIDICDISGRRVKSLVDAEREAGIHEIQWDGSDESGYPVASGLYLVRMRAENFHQTKRVLLLK